MRNYEFKYSKRCMSPCPWDDQFARGRQSCVDVDVGGSVETLETEAEGGSVEHDSSRWWWHQTDCDNGDDDYDHDNY